MCYIPLSTERRQLVELHGECRGKDGGGGGVETELLQRNVNYEMITLQDNCCNHNKETLKLVSKNCQDNKNVFVLTMYIRCMLLTLSPNFVCLLTTSLTICYLFL